MVNASSPYTLLAVGLLLVILILSLCARHLAQKDLKLFSALSKKRKGKVYTDPFTSWATAVFPYKSAEVTVFQRKGVSGKRIKTCIKYPLELPDNTTFHLTKGITGQTSIKELSQFLVLPKIEIGTEEFSKVFVVHGNDQDFIRRILDSELQNRLLRLKSSAPTVFIHAQKEAFYRKSSGEFCKHMLEFSLNEVPTNLEELEKIVKTGLNIINALTDIDTKALSVNSI
jgi:hypothetical protein